STIESAAFRVLRQVRAEGPSIPRKYFYAFSALLSTAVPVQTKDLSSKIRDVPDFPKPGILFKDITTLLKDGDSFTAAIDGLLAKIGTKKIDAVVGMESRGFIFAAPIAYKLGVGFVPVRKLGKLPGDVVSVE